jgi:hypothetical protein
VKRRGKKKKKKDRRKIHTSKCSKVQTRASDLAAVFQAQEAVVPPGWESEVNLFASSPSSSQQQQQEEAVASLPAEAKERQQQLMVVIDEAVLMDVTFEDVKDDVMETIEAGNILNTSKDGGGGDELGKKACDRTENHELDLHR